MNHPQPPIPAQPIKPPSDAVRNAYAAVNTPAYLHPDTARALLDESRQRIAKLRAERELREQLRHHGWSDSACAELAEIHIELNPQPAH